MAKFYFVLYFILLNFCPFLAVHRPFSQRNKDDRGFSTNDITTKIRRRRSRRRSLDCDGDNGDNRDS
jgi:hypothetical protein